MYGHEYCKLLEVIFLFVQLRNAHRDFFRI